MVSPKPQKAGCCVLLGSYGLGWKPLTLTLSCVWIKYNPSLFFSFLWAIKFKNSPQRRWSFARPELVCLLSVPNMIFILKNYLFLKRVHWRCHPSYQQPHWALVSDIQTFKLKSSFRRELLKFKWAGHIEEESSFACTPLRLAIPFSPSEQWLVLFL